MLKYKYFRNIIFLIMPCIIMVFIYGCSKEYYEDQKIGITVKKLGSDLDDRWSLNGVIVDSVKPGSKADNNIKAGELISYVIDERAVNNKKKFNGALSDALAKDDRAILRISKTISASDINDLGMQVKRDPEERGVIVATVTPLGKADISGVMPNSVIYTIDNEPVTSVEKYNEIASQKLQANGKITLNLAREIVAKKLSKVGIDGEDGNNGVLVKKLEIISDNSSPAIREGIKEGDLITHVIDEIKIEDISSYKKAIKKSADADKVIFRRGEIGGIKLTLIDALGLIADTRAIPPLVSLLESNDRWIRRASASALSGMNDPSIIQPLLNHLLEANEPDPEVRKSSAEALAKLRPVEAIEPLAMALRDSSLGVRLIAGYALGRIGVESTEILVKASQDSDSRVRDIAVATLGTIGGKPAKEELKKVLHNQNEEPTVKLTAIQALYKIGDPDSIAELRKVAESGESGLSAFVKELLAEESAKM